MIMLLQQARLSQKGGFSSNLLVLSSDHKSLSQGAAARRLKKVHLEREPDVFIAGEKAYVTGVTNDGPESSGLVSLFTDPPHQVCTFKLYASYGIKQKPPLPGSSTP